MISFFFFRSKMSENTFVSTIEFLSVELWQEIFEYFSPVHLWYSFRGINRKIDLIVDRTALYLNFRNQVTYNYFMNFGKFITNLNSKRSKSFNNIENEYIKNYISNSNNKEEKELNTYIICLCKMYIGHNLHYKLNEEISKKTNLNILKGDYLFSSGYYLLAKLGNPLLIKYYTKISIILAKVSFI